MHMPFLTFGAQGEQLHFAHANGYPPGAYRPLLQALGERYRVYAMDGRPLWPQASHAVLTDWRPLASDLIRFLEDHMSPPVVGIGHSVGANATLRAAIYRPDLFRALVLIDPVLFSPLASVWWNLIYYSGLARQIHPLAQGARRRRRVFDSKQAMFENYRRKRVFRRMDDQALWAYVDAMSTPVPNGNQVVLRYSPEWEERIYITGLRADLEIWRALPKLKLPMLILRGEHTDTFLSGTAKRFQRKAPHTRIVTLPDCTHLLPLERPDEIARQVQEFLDP
ncbi:MAG: alpha/beta hydrolase [Anaerolineales bacterium]